MKNTALQIPAQQASESAGTELQEHEKKPTFVGSVDSLPDGATAQNAEERTRCFSVIPYITKTLEQCEKSDSAESGAVSVAALDSRLQAIILHWLDIPETLRSSVFRQVCETLVLQSFNP